MFCRSLAYIFAIILPCLAVTKVAPSQTNSTKASEVPVLCYHQVIYQKKAGTSITISPKLFAAQIKMLHDSGFHFITANDLLQHLLHNKQLPPKPILISFDDNTISQYKWALPVLNKYHIKALFFVMTVSINKPGYMSADQLKTLIQQNHTIGAHTWDHQNVKSYEAVDWVIQLDKPLLQLQKITGTPLQYFAYPYGAWNEKAIKALQQRKIQMAFILHTAQSKTNPLFTIRRLMINSSMTPTVLFNNIGKTFN